MRALRTGRAQAGVVARLGSSEGAGRWICINSEPILEAGVALPVAVVMTFADISEKKLAVEELRIRQHEMEEAQRLARVDGWTWQVAGDKVQWSRELYRIVGLEPANEAPPFAKQARFIRLELVNVDGGGWVGAADRGTV